MKKTFDLLAKLNFEDLKMSSSKKVQEFLSQLRSDCKEYISLESFNSNDTADRWLKEVRLLAKNTHPAICKNSLDKIDKIYTLLDGQGGDASTLLEMYQSVETVRVEILKEVVSDYEAHLAKKIEELNFLISKEEGVISISNLNKEDITPAQQKLLNRYQAIAAFNEKMKDTRSINESTFSEAQDVFITCLKNKPDWSERPFLQRLTDVLSVGFKPLYRAFFSKEAQLEKKIEHILPETPKLGG